MCIFMHGAIMVQRQCEYVMSCMVMDGICEITNAVGKASD